MIERIAFILLINLVYFAKTLGYKYTSDDIPVFHASKDLKYKPIKRIFEQVKGSTRVSPQQDHFITMIVHALICVFIYTSFGANDISFIASFLFCFNPINNQGSVWISGRGYTMPTLLLLITLTFPILAPLTVFLAMYYNMGFLASPVLVFWNPWLAIPLGINGLIHTKKMKHDVKQKFDRESFGEDKVIHPKKLIFVVKTFGFYLSHALIPVKTTFYHSFMQSMAGSGMRKAYSIDRFLFIGMFSILAILYKILFTPWDLVSFGLIWWCIGIAPFLNLCRMSQEIAERYVYFANIGLMLALSIYLNIYPILIPVFLTMYATRLWFYMDAFQDEFYLAETSALNSPDSWFAWHVMALKRWEHKSYNEAIVMWTMAKMIHPKEFKVLYNLASMLKIMGNHQEAAQYLAEAANNQPKGQEKQISELMEKWSQGNYGVLV